MYPGPVPPEVVAQVVARLNQILAPTFEGASVAEPYENTIHVDGTARWDNRSDIVGRCVFAFWEPAEEYIDIHLHIIPDIDPVGHADLELASLFTEKRTRPSVFATYKELRSKRVVPTYEHLA